MLKMCVNTVCLRCVVLFTAALTWNGYSCPSWSAACAPASPLCDSGALKHHGQLLCPITPGHVTDHHAIYERSVLPDLHGRPEGSAVVPVLAERANLCCNLDDPPVAGHISFAARLPRGLADRSAAREGLQLCSRGCPERERIDYRHVLSAGRSVSTVHAGRPAELSRGLVTDLCRQQKLTDFYLDACVFDVLFTGKTSFMGSAREAQQDVKRLMRQAVRQLQENRTQLRLTPSDSSAPGRGELGNTVVLMAVAVTALMWLTSQ